MKVPPYPGLRHLVIKGTVTIKDQAKTKKFGSKPGKSLSVTSRRTRWMRTLDSSPDLGIPKP